MTTPAGTTAYTYDPLNRLKQVTDINNGVTSYNYNPVGTLANRTLPNGIHTTFSYDNLYRPTGITHLESLTPNAPVLADFTYSYDPVGNRTQVIEGDGTIIDYSYDERYRLIAENVTDGAVAQSTNYTYNAANNRTQMVSNGVTTTYDYNNLDQLTQMIADNVTTDYTYDNRGNLLTETTNSVTTDYTWDARDRLIEVDKPGTLVSYVYDYQGNRVQQTFNTEVTNFVWDTLSRFGDVVAETNDTGTLTTAYTLAMGHVLSQHSSSADHYLLEDIHGSTRLLTDSATAILTTFDYDAYGQLTAQNGTVETKYLYNGQQYDEVLQLYSLRARYYNPLQGRFLSRDKHTGNYQNELNRYVYTANNPVMFGDASGMQAMKVFSKLLKFGSKISNGIRQFFTKPFVEGFMGGVGGYLLGIFIYNEFFNDGPDENVDFGQLIFSGLFGGIFNVIAGKIQKATSNKVFSYKKVNRTPGPGGFINRTTEFHRGSQLIAKVGAYGLSAVFIGWLNQAVNAIFNGFEGAREARGEIALGAFLSTVGLLITDLAEGSKIARVVSIAVDITGSTLTSLLEREEVRREVGRAI